MSKGIIPLIVGIFVFTLIGTSLHSNSSDDFKKNLPKELKSETKAQVQEYVLNEVKEPLQQMTLDTACKNGEESQSCFNAKWGVMWTNLLIAFVSAIGIIFLFLALVERLGIPLRL